MARLRGNGFAGVFRDGTRGLAVRCAARLTGARSAGAHVSDGYARSHESIRPHRCAVVRVSDLRRFVAVVDAGVHVPRGAEALGTPLRSVHSSMDRLETEAGHPLFTRSPSGWTLTEAGVLLLDEARRRIADAPEAAEKPVVSAGGKARASKGKGRAPVVKGQPKPYKKRQGR